MMAPSRQEMRRMKALADDHLELLDGRVRPYGRTLRRALSDPAVEGHLRRIAEGPGELAVLDMGCGRWDYIHRIVSVLSEAFPRRGLLMVGADPYFRGAEGIERLAKELVRSSGKARLVEAPLAVSGHAEAKELLGIAGVRRFDIILSFNYIPFFRSPHLDAETRELIRPISSLSPEIQSSRFFHSMRVLLADGGLAVVISAQDFPVADIKLREAGMEILLHRMNDESDRDFPFNDRITVARKA